MSLKDFAMFCYSHGAPGVVAGFLPSSRPCERILTAACRINGLRLLRVRHLDSVL